MVGYGPFHLMILNENIFIAIKKYYELNKIKINKYEDINNVFNSACFKGMYEIVKWLLEIKPDIDINNYTFNQACYSGSIEIVKILLEKNPDIDISKDNEEAFFISCSNGHINLSKFLLEKKGDINISIINQSIFKHTCE